MTATVSTLCSNETASPYDRFTCIAYGMSRNTVAKLSRCLLPDKKSKNDLRNVLFGISWPKFPANNRHSHCNLYEGKPKSPNKEGNYTKIE